jgi:hypothetical protein
MWKEKGSIADNLMKYFNKLTPIADDLMKYFNDPIRSVNKI